MESSQNIKQIIKAELPKIMETDPEIHDFILRLTRKQCADRNQTDDRIERLFEDLKRDRAISEKRWEENQKKWEENQKELRELRLEQNKKWEENQKELRELRLEQNKKWEENQKELRELRLEQNKKWEENQKELRELRLEQNKKWEENDRKWEENQKEIREMIKSMSKLSQKVDSSIGALGTRWGLHSEASFRNGLKAILTESFGVRVERYEDYDYEGMVFGRPDQIELDVIIHNGDIILCEIKSSISKSEMHVFYRKKEYYEKKHGRRVNRTMVISPMIDPLAMNVARELGIETYSYADGVTL